MKCPRCGTENHTPEVTGNKCYHCGFSLLGEVSRHDVRRAVRRRFVIGLMVPLLVLVSAGYYAWTQDWFGLFSRRFVASDAPERMPVIGAGSLPLTVGDASGIFLREESWSVDAMVVAPAKFETGTLGALAPYHILLAWGPAGQYQPNSFKTEFDERNARIISQDPAIDTTALTEFFGVAQILATGGTLEERVSKMSVGAKVRLTGYLVSGTVEGERILPVVPGSADGSVASYLLEITGFERL